MNVLFNDMHRCYDRHAEEYEAAALRAMRSGWYILGGELQAFERQFAQWLGIDHCIGVNCGQDALILAVRALGIGPGDEVIVPANTYIASVLGVTENGATPVFVEPDGFYNLAADKLEGAITEKTRAILPVHLYGQACNMRAICDIAKRHGLYIIEDCAQAHGACFDGQPVGTFGDLGCFSFYPTKPIGALGDAGAVVTHSAELAQRLRMMRNYGSGKKYYNEIEGVNSRLDELQAAVLQVSLRHAEEDAEARAEIAQRYLNGIVNPAVMLPQLREGATNVWHVFPLRTAQRDALQAALAERGVQTLIHYPVPPYLQACYRRLGLRAGDFPVAEQYAAQELSLPIYAGMPQEEVDWVIACVNEWRPQ